MTAHTFAPLFDDADLIALAGRVSESDFSRWNTYDKDSTSVELPWHVDDIASRIIHDRQFMDLSERYDPVEPTDEALADVSRRDRRAIWAAVAAVVALQLVTVAVALIL